MLKYLTYLVVGIYSKRMSHQATIEAIANTEPFPHIQIMIFFNRNSSVLSKYVQINYMPERYSTVDSHYVFLHNINLIHNIELSNNNLRQSLIYRIPGCYA